MFRFNFDNCENSSSTHTSEEDSKIHWYECEEVKIPFNISSLIKKIPTNQILDINYDEEIDYLCLSATEVMNMLKEKSEFVDALKANEKHSDLLPGKYEGGLKTWECTKDLAVYFMNNEIKMLDERLKNKYILDLGCGCGILGIMSLVQGGQVTFQDYNKEVLQDMTIPNIFLNVDESYEDRVKLYCGDWSSFLNKMIQENQSKFDYILTSETIYNPHNYIKIIEILKNLLKPNGIGYVAAKEYYFGVGGNLQEFQSLLEKNELPNTICWETNEGINRKILKVILPFTKELEK